ncbi:MAG: hypothetical protein L0K86_24690 [Actinomycetia bacterium]|nr:hypothetical protein [Actinomycetes bacterium]
MQTLLLVAVVLAAGYLLACAVWPYTACGRCRGTGKRRSPTGRAWRPCRPCRGTGRRVRAGRRAYELLRGFTDE